MAKRGGPEPPPIPTSSIQHCLHSELVAFLGADTEASPKETRKAVARQEKRKLLQPRQFEITRLPLRVVMSVHPGRSELMAKPGSQSPLSTDFNHIPLPSFD